MIKKQYDKFPFLGNNKPNKKVPFEPHFIFWVIFERYFKFSLCPTTASVDAAKKDARMKAAPQVWYFLASLFVAMALNKTYSCFFD